MSGHLPKNKQNKMETKNYTGKVGVEELVKNIDSLPPEQRTQFLEKISEKSWFGTHQDQMGKFQKTNGRGQKNETDDQRNRDRQKDIHGSSVGGNMGIGSRETKGRENKVPGEYQV